MNCPTCAHPTPDGSLFCEACGAKLELTCSACGATNQPSARFCKKCGARIAKESARANASHSGAGESSAPAVRIAAEQADASSIEGERKTVTALFADIKGSMDLMEDIDPEEARGIVDPALKLMIDAAHRYEGYIVQSTGDGIFAIFGAPVAHEDHPQRALYAALRMQEDVRRHAEKLRAEKGLNLQVRVGVNTGEVVVRSIKTDEAHTEYTPIGHSTSLASRLQALAAPGSIAISEPVRKLVEGYFALKSMGPARIKGVSEPVNVYEVTGLGPLRTRLQRSAGRGLSKFVGRQAEMEALKRAAEQAKAAHGQIVAAMAEAGVGKSRLFFEFKAVSQSGWNVLEAFSVSHGKSSAYLPVTDLLRNYFKISIEDDDRQRREKVAGKIVILDRALEDAVPYLYTLLGIGEENDPLEQMDAQIRKSRTLDAVKRLLLRESLNQPLMVIFEDLHWIDEETQALLNLLADSIGTAKILLLVNYRPEYTHSWGSKTYYTQLRLDPLGKESADEMLTALLGDGVELAPLKHLLIEKTEGNPFFMEETVQMLLDDGALMRGGAAAAAKLTKPLGELKIPPTVQAILASRIDRLPADEKDLLQTLAVIGKEFPLALVRAVTATAEDELNRKLTALQLGEFIYEQPAAGDIEYTFKHALTQEVAYNSLLLERRRQIHERAAAALEEVYAGRIDDHLAEVATHYRRSGNAQKAIVYLRRAADQASERSAYEDAISYLRSALEILGASPETAERMRRELELLSMLGMLTAAVRGLASVELEGPLARAKELLARCGASPEIIGVVAGLWSVTFSRGRLLDALKLAAQSRELAASSDLLWTDAGSLTALGSTNFWLGNPRAAREYLQRATELYSKDIAACLASPLVPVVPSYSTLAWTLWVLGYPDQSARRIGEALTLANRLGRPYNIAMALQFAIAVGDLSGNAAAATAQARTLLEIAQMNGFPQWVGAGEMSLGGVMIQGGEYDQGFPLLRQGLDRLRKSGGDLVYRYGLVLLAGACLKAGRIDESFAALDECASYFETDGERMHEAEVLRLRGELLLASGTDRKQAEALFREAIDVARKQDAKAWELRATTSLARLLAKQGKRDEARAMLAEIYNWFTEGFDTADLKDAKALLGELND
jgi:class 3 adenylate cyclase/tetratricopeptide (TPR) repeat protein